MDLDLTRTICLNVKQLVARTVIVYGDRAEVKRLIELDLETEGDYTILVQNLSPVIEPKSIRVEGRRLVEISQVQYEEQPLTKQSVVHIELEQMESTKTAKEKEKLELEDELHVLRKRLDILDGVAGQIGQNSVSITKEVTSPTENNNCVFPSFLLCNEAMQNLGQFLDYYAKNASDLRQQFREKERCLNALISELELLEKEVDQLRCRLEYDNINRNLRIVVKASNAGKAQIVFCYQVYCVSWRPAYDIRASTSQNGSCDDFSKLDLDALDASDQFTPLSSNTPNEAQISYYGIVEQKTEENWDNVELVLSTAQPCVASTLPPLPTLTAAFHRPQSLFRQRNFSAHRRPLSNDSDEDIGIGSFDYNDYADAVALQRLSIARSNSDSDINSTREQVPSSCFAIEAPATIHSDGNHYRVLISRMGMEPRFMHEANPSKATTALLSAEIVNTSALPLLHGQASVFLNNSFTCQIQLKTVLPGEQFCCSLGVDPSVKIEYKPAKRTKEKIGFMSKSSLTTHEQVIRVRNAKVGEKINLTVREPIPRPIDDKIKVTILSPDLRAGRTEALVTKDNHLEWVCELSAGEQRDLTVKWSMEFPLNEAVVYASKIGSTTTATSWTPHASKTSSSNYYSQQLIMGSHQQRVY